MGRSRLMGAEIGAWPREPEASGLSVVVATDGRSPHLSDVVAAAARDPAVDDVNVVANGAGSRLVSEMDFPADARVFVVDEGNLSIARNLGLERAAHEIVAFLDDDAVPDEGWGNGYHDRFNGYPAVGAAGGPAWVGDSDRLPDSFLGAAVGYLALIDFDTPRQCAPCHYPIGCNFAVRRSAVQEVGGFRSDLGYSGDLLMPHEETELFHRLHSASWEVWWEARSRVEHRVASGKRRLGYLLRRAYSQGRGDVRLTLIHPDFQLDSRPFDGVRVAQSLSRAILAFAAGNRRAAVDAALWSARLAGRMRGVPSAKV